MSTLQILLLTPGQCTREQLDQFHDLVISGKQVQEEGLSERIAGASLLGFAYLEDQLAGVASVKNQKRSYVIGIFLKAKVPRLADAYQYEVGYAVTHNSFRRKGVSRSLIAQLMKSKPDTSFYATTKNDGMRELLIKSGFNKLGNSYQNAGGETLDLYVSK